MIYTLALFVVINIGCNEPQNNAIVNQIQVGNMPWHVMEGESYDWILSGGPYQKEDYEFLKRRPKNCGNCGNIKILHINNNKKQLCVLFTKIMPEGRFYYNPHNKNVLLYPEDDDCIFVGYKKYTSESQYYLITPIDILTLLVYGEDAIGKVEWHDNKPNSGFGSYYNNYWVSVTFLSDHKHPQVLRGHGTSTFKYYNPWRP